MLTKQITIINKLGLHARASSKLVELANKFNCKITMEKNHKIANAKSIMTVMMLAANKGSVVTITTDGEDEEAALFALEQLINNRFGEIE
jgi:phosphocarrier protein